MIIKIKKIKKWINNPFGPSKFINAEHIIGPAIAPIPKIILRPPPAATNFSLGIWSFTKAKFNENRGSVVPDKRIINKKSFVLSIVVEK